MSLNILVKGGHVQQDNSSNLPAKSSRQLPHQCEWILLRPTEWWSPILVRRDPQRISLALASWLNRSVVLWNIQLSSKLQGFFSLSFIVISLNAFCSLQILFAGFIYWVPILIALSLSFNTWSNQIKSNWIKSQLIAGSLLPPSLFVATGGRPSELKILLL